MRDGVLARLLTELTQTQSGQDETSPDRAACTIQDIGNARLASPMWREVIDSTAEWAAVRLAAWDYANESSPLWEAFFVSFFLNWHVFGKSWRMRTPIAIRHLRVDPIGTLNCADLHVLRALL